MGAGGTPRTNQQSRSLRGWYPEFTKNEQARATQTRRSFSPHPTIHQPSINHPSVVVSCSQMRAPISRLEIKIFSNSSPFAAGSSSRHEGSIIGGPHVGQCGQLWTKGTAKSCRHDANAPFKCPIRPRTPPGRPVRPPANLLTPSFMPVAKSRLPNSRCS